MKRTVTSLALVVALLGGQQIFAQSAPSYHQLKERGMLRGYTNEQLMQMQMQDSYVPPAVTASSVHPPISIQSSVLTAGPDTTICGGSVTLTATLLAGAGTPVSWCSGTPPDDGWSNPVNIPFLFAFYGAAHNQVLVGSNDVVSFNTQNACAYNTWPINGAEPVAFPADITNTVQAPWQDLYPPLSGTIQYAVVGTAPNRVFVVDYCDVPMFSCNNLLCSSQFQFYEGTNVIETHILWKDLCTQWNAGAAIHGVQNASGSIANIVPGQNYPNQYTISQLGTRFTYNCSNYTISTIPFSPIPLANPTINWYDASGNLIGTGAQITVTPTATTDYIASVTSACGNVTYSDTATVTLGGILGNISITPSSASVCAGGSVQLTATGGSTYMWSPGGSLDDSTIANPTATPSATTTYTVVVGNGSGCTGTATATVSVNGSGPTVSLSTSGGSCNAGVILIGWPGNPVTIQANAPGAVSYLWSNGATSSSIQVTQGGIYCVTATDANGCTGSACDTIPTGVNVACGHNNQKVILCHVPPGNPGNPQTICVAASAIPSHLANHPGDCVGPCSLYYAPRYSEVLDQIDQIGFFAEAYPNPSTSGFALHLVVAPDEAVTVNIHDVTGRIVETYNNVTEQTIIGSNLAAGTYTANVIQGENHQMLRVVKE